MQVHAAVGEHLAVQPVVAAVALGQQRGDLVGDRADPRLQGRAGRHEVNGVPRDRLIDVGGRRFPSWQRERCVSRAHQDVDLIDVQRMAILAEAERSRIGVRDLNDEQPIGIGTRAVQFADRATRVQRQGAPAVGIGGRRDGRHHARGPRFEQRPEAAEVRGREIDVGAGGPQRPLERTEETRQVMHARPREQFSKNREQRTVDAQICPVLALAERTQKRRRLAGAERHPQGVDGRQASGGLLGGQLLWHGATLPTRLSRTVGERPATC